MADISDLRGFLRRLTPRLVLLTGAFIMVAELLLLWPSLGAFRADWLDQRLAEAKIAALAVAAAPEGMVRGELEADLLDEVGAHVIDLRPGPGHNYRLAREEVPLPDRQLRLDRIHLPGHMLAALGGLGHYPGDIVEIRGRVSGKHGGEMIVIMDEAPLISAMVGFIGRILLLSLAIALFTTALLYVCLRGLLLAPIRRIMDSLIAFRARPESAVAMIRPSGRTDEIGETERELAAMQETLRETLTHKTRLAALGTAVAKINHDLRGILATASLISERLESSRDPETRQIAPRLVAAIDQAAELCAQSLAYVRSGRTPLDLQPLALRMLVDGLGHELCPPPRSCDFAWINDVPPDSVIEADNVQLARVLRNLARNALQAGATELRFEIADPGDAAAGPEADSGLVLRIADNGPGLPRRTRETLFQPFSGGGAEGGAGLGLAIAAEILAAHGGRLELESTGEAGTAFRLHFPPPQGLGRNQAA